MQGTSTEPNIFDLLEIIRSNAGLIPLIVVFHSLWPPHCFTIAMGWLK